MGRDAVSPASEPMRRALELAHQAQGRTSPNPPVGAVLVQDGQVVGEGYTQPAGGPHAEIVALREAGDAARGAALYVTLEPCSHWGRTPPCADALLEAGVAEVHAAVLDPNPSVHGQGAGRLRAGGVPVTVGEGAEDASELLRAHAVYTGTGRPLVTLFFSGPRDAFEQEAAAADVLLVDEATGQEDAVLGSMQRGRGADTAAVLLPGGTVKVVDMRPPQTAGSPPPLDLRPAMPDYETLLAELGAKEVTSVLVRAGQATMDGLLAAGIGDTVVVAPGRQPPAGFGTERKVHGGTRSRSFYRDGTPLRS